eukprot:348639-Alexandrium_andersonii.AAC.1
MALLREVLLMHPWRERGPRRPLWLPPRTRWASGASRSAWASAVRMRTRLLSGCLLYTSDAADDM